MAGGEVITIGNFDGVHLGHQTILRHARQMAEQEDLTVTAITFDPLPASVLRPGFEPPRLMRVSDRIEALRHWGADQVQVYQPTPKLLSLAPEVFIKQVVARHHPRAIVEGPDFRFGKDRAGDMALLRELSQSLGFEVVLVAQMEAALEDQLLVTVRSSLLRWLIRHGRVADAGRCLGAPFGLSGLVVAGQKRGRDLGVPTANLDRESLAGMCVPMHGVYAGAVYLSDTIIYPAAISVGVKPTFGERTTAVEAHLLGFDGDLYGQTIRISFGRWIRDQQTFATSSALTAQLQRDIEQVRRWHAMGLLNTAPPAQPVGANR